MQRDSFIIPIAIVIAGALIAGAVYFSGSKTTSPQSNPFATESTEPVIRPIDDTDHIRGNPNAPIIIVEYSDFDCPFCNDFHKTMTRVMENYGPGGKVAWAFRHFPITSSHPNAARIAEASECAAELGGDAAFWKFTDVIFNSKTYEEFTDISKLTEYAKEAGVTDTQAFETCLSGGKYSQKIVDSIDEAQKTRAEGTPHTILMVGNQIIPLGGAVKYDTLAPFIDNLIAQIEGNTVAQ